MLKKIAMLGCLSCVALTTTLRADAVNEKMDSSEPYSGGFTLGTNVDMSPLGSLLFLTAGYISDCFLFDVGVNYSNQEVYSTNASFSTFMGHLGLRNRIFQNLFVTYGVTGSVVAGDNFRSGSSYSVGAFTGLDLQITRHFLLSGKINPYIFGHPTDHITFNEVFSTGSIALSYVF